MNPKIFFDHVRESLFGGHMTPDQVDGMRRILAEWEARKLLDVRWLAYMLATVFHETGRKMQPIPEEGSEAYLKAKKYWPWIGRGLVQITWQTNYAKFGITNPDDALTWPVALKVLFDGMIMGRFTGSSLPHYFSPLTDDPLHARRIVNGNDRAELIAGYYRGFLLAIRDAQGTPVAATVPKPAAPLTPASSALPWTTKPASPGTGFWAWVRSLFAGKAA